MKVVLELKGVETRPTWNVTASELKRWLAERGFIALRQDGEALTVVPDDALAEWMTERGKADVNGLWWPDYVRWRDERRKRKTMQTVDTKKLKTIGLTYFKAGGKYYSSGSFQTTLDSWHEMIDAVRAMHDGGVLPGLVAGTREFAVLIEAGEPWGVPHFLPAYEQNVGRTDISASSSKTSKPSKPAGAERLPALVEELILDLLDELVPLGEMMRYIGSARQTVHERECGFVEFCSEWNALQRSLVKDLVARLMEPVPPDDDEVEDAAARARRTD